ncbi:MAG: YfiR family protein [Rhodanobacteraceae bacterium]
MAECALLMVLLLAGAEAFAQSPPPNVSLEYAVKATYLYKMAPFVNWPPDTFTSPAAPFEICVLGQDPFHGFLEKAVAGRGLGSHPFAVHHLETAAAGAGCQIVFIAYSRAAEVRTALRVFDGKPVLTVTDSDAVDGGGCVVQFVMDNGHVRFEVDNAAAVRNQLAISSKLLDLALAVKGAG